MNGVVSLLDIRHDQAIRDLWVELAEHCGLNGISVTPIPHFSYHVAQSYADEALEMTLGQVAAELETFEVQTSGLGIFTAPSPVLYIPVTRTAELSHLHHRLWHLITQHSSGALSYYQPAAWTPHITLAHNDLTLDALMAALRLLSHRSFNWRIKIDNLATIYAAGPQHELRSRFELGKPFSLGFER